jgi:hypothetical protein
MTARNWGISKRQSAAQAADEAAAIAPHPHPMAAADSFPTALLPTTPPHAVGNSAGACAQSASADFSSNLLTPNLDASPNPALRGSPGQAKNHAFIPATITHMRSLPYASIGKRTFTPDWAELERALGLA